MGRNKGISHIRFTKMIDELMEPAILATFDKVKQSPVTVADIYYTMVDMGLPDRSPTRARGMIQNHAWLKPTSLGHYILDKPK